MEQKYKLVAVPDDIRQSHGWPKYQIQALREIRANWKNVRPGDLGGFVDGEHNLSQQGSCWISGYAQVVDDAYVSDNAIISGNAVVKDQASVSGDAAVQANAIISDHASVADQAYVLDAALVTDYARVGQKASIKNDAWVRGRAAVAGEAIVGDHAVVSDRAVVGGSARITDYMTIEGDSVVDANKDIPELVSHVAGFSAVEDIVDLALLAHPSEIVNPRTVSRCGHIGTRTKKKCIRVIHVDENHRYE